MDPFVFIPIALYLVFTGLFVQQGLMNIVLEKNVLTLRRKYLVRFVFASAAFCLSLLWVLLAPIFDSTPSHVRWSFYLVWLVAPIVGYLYTLTLAEHLMIPFRRVRWLTRCSLFQFLVTLLMGIYTFISGQFLLFSDQAGSYQSRIDIHLGGAFSPNLVTVIMVIFTIVVVSAAVTFFLKELMNRSQRDLSLIIGAMLTAFAIIVEQVGYLLQWPFIFSLMPLANSVEILRITYLQTIEAGGSIEQARTQVRRDHLQIQNHLTALSHDVNTPLTSLKLCLGKLKEQGVDKALTTKVTRELEYMHIVSANLLTLFQLELSSVNSTHIHMQPKLLIEGIIARFEMLAEEMGVAIEWTSQDNMPSIFCDPNLLEQSIGNLIYNAVIHAHSQVSIELAKREDLVSIDIIDDGDPVPSFAVPSLADRGYRSFLEQKLGCPGWGLGVAIANAFAENHHGSLVISTRTDGHTSVSLTLAGAS